jgi:hypothetical protein
VTNRAWKAAKLTAIGMGLVVASALVTGVVVANRPGHESAERAATPAAAAPAVSSQPATPDASGASGGEPYAPCMWSLQDAGPPCHAP